MTFLFKFPELDHLPRLPDFGTAKDFPQVTVERRDIPTAIRRYLPIAAILMVCTILFRLPDFGNPTYHIDEAFYLFFGRELNAGFQPYIDIWDRKPFGLFILYALLARFESVFAYQAAAMLFVCATSLAIGVMAMRFAGRMAAIASGILYIAVLGAFAGGGGQSPVFYNLFVAVAALLAMKALLGETPTLRSASDYMAMLFCGVALTIKPTALPEGIFVGIVLITARWRATRSLPTLPLYALQLCAAAVLPTALILLYFWANGNLADYLFATIRSIFLTEGHSATKIFWQALNLAKRLEVVLPMALLGLAILVCKARKRGGKTVLVASFIGGWLLSATIGFLMVPNFYDHYMLPVASSLALASAAVFDRPALGRAAAIAAVGHMLLTSGFPSVQIMRAKASQDGYEKAARLISDNAGSGCVFLYDVTAALYRGVRPCPANKYAFTEHLSNQREARAIGADPVRALQTVLSDHPSVIALSARPSVYTPNLTTRAIVNNYLAAEYREVEKVDLFDVDGHQAITIWQRNPYSARADNIRDSRTRTATGCPGSAACNTGIPSHASDKEGEPQSPPS